MKDKLTKVPYWTKDQNTGLYSKRAWGVELDIYASIVNYEFDPETEELYLNFRENVKHPKRKRYFYDTLLNPFETFFMSKNDKIVYILDCNPLNPLSQMLLTIWESDPAEVAHKEALIDKALKTLP